MDFVFLYMFLFASHFNNKTPISRLWHFEARHNTEKTLSVEPEKRPYIVEDRYCYLIGHLDRTMLKGEKVHLCLTDARVLYDMLKRQFRG